MNEHEKYEYTYSAGEQAEILKIRKKYTPKEENKLEKLRRLDNQVTSRATMAALIFGIVGTLIFGSGMSMALLGGGFWMFLGIVVGVLGLLPVALAYPVYVKTLDKERARVAEEILQLTDELMK